MTRFNHAQRNSKHKRAKKRARKGLDIDGRDRLVAHRELQYLRDPLAEPKMERVKKAMK